MSEIQNDGLSENIGTFKNKIRLDENHIYNPPSQIAQEHPSCEFLISHFFDINIIQFFIEYIVVMCLSYSSRIKYCIVYQKPNFSYHRLYCKIRLF